MDEHVTPEPILQLGLAFWGSTFGMCTVRMPSLLSQRIASEFTFSGREKVRSNVP